MANILPNANLQIFMFFNLTWTKKIFWICTKTLLLSLPLLWKVNVRILKCNIQVLELTCLLTCLSSLPTTHTHTHALCNWCLISVESTLSPHMLMLFLLPLNCPLCCTHPSARTGDACTQALTALHVNKPAPKCLTDTFEMTSSMRPVLALLLLVVVVLTLGWF